MTVEQWNNNLKDTCIAFYFDVGGVLIPDKFAPQNAINVFRELAESHGFDPDSAYGAYLRLQPLLDLGDISLTELCGAIGVGQKAFEHDWLLLHPIDQLVVSLIERLVRDGNRVGLATNMCRRLLELLVGNLPPLSRSFICCSSEIRQFKPSLAFFRRASDIMPADETVFVDDRAVNIGAARNFGWTAIQATEDWVDRFERKYLL